MSFQARPWSPDEIAERIPKLVNDVADALAELRVLGDRASRAKWTYEKSYAQAILLAEESNAEKRKASAMLHRFADGTTVAERGLAMDLADRAYKDQQASLRALDTELRICQSMLVSARQMGPDR